MTLKQRAFFSKWGIEVSFTYDENPCIHIKNSYLVNIKKDRETILKYIHGLSEYQKLLDVGYTRTDKSQLQEWDGHNFLYKIGYQRNRTSDVSIDQNEPKWRRVCYAILSLFMR